MKNPFRDIEWRKLSLLRILLVAAVGLIGLAIIFALLSTVIQLTGVSKSTVSQSGSSYVGNSVTMVARAPAVGVDTVMGERVASGVVPMPPLYSDSGGTRLYNEANYEARSYDVRYRVRDLDMLCNQIEQFKPLPHVVFEQQMRNEHTCYYHFKVTQGYASATVSWLLARDPDDLTASTDVVKKQLVRYSSQMDILLQKQEVIEQTLQDTLSAYGELIDLATRANDIESLTKVVDSKLAMVQKLSQQRLTLAQQIGVLTRQQADLQDRVDFVSFAVRVEQYDILDLVSLKNSWMNELRAFVVTINSTLQRFTLHLIENLFALALLLVYAVILLVLVKHGWREVKRFWVSEGSGVPTARPLVPPTPKQTARPGRNRMSKRVVRAPGKAQRKNGAG